MSVEKQPSWDEAYAVVHAARRLDAVLAGTPLPAMGMWTKQAGDFHQAAQELHLALERLPKPHVHGGWLVVGFGGRADSKFLVLRCATCPLEVETPNKIPIEVPE
jgi:hypothetical protein